MSEASSCPGSETPAPGCRLGALYWACVRNDPVQLQAALDGGVSPEEAVQVDGNGRTGLMVACYRGFENVVALLSRCPFLDVNQQDKEGDTALMLAAQAGHVPLVSLLLNYYPGLDLERRDQRGLTALMKAAIRNRSECVAALLLAGAELTAVDPVRGKTALEWAVLTDSFDTVQRIRKLLRRPQIEQLSQHYQPEWPALPGLVAQAQAQAAPSLLERLQATLSLPFTPFPQEGGVLDHLVTITTSLASPFLTTACHTLCPEHPPALGTRSKSVPELLGTAPPPPPDPQPPQVAPGPRALIPYQSPQGVLSMCPQWLQPRDNSSPRPQAPKIRLSKAPSSPRQHKPESRPGENRSMLGSSTSGQRSSSRGSLSTSETHPLSMAISGQLGVPGLRPASPPPRPFLSNPLTASDSLSGCRGGKKPTWLALPVLPRVNLSANIPASSHASPAPEPSKWSPCQQRPRNSEQGLWLCRTRPWQKCPAKTNTWA